MPDITMCFNSDCPLSSSCYRHEAEPSEFQSYFVGDPSNNSPNTCAYYWPRTKRKQVRITKVHAHKYYILEDHTLDKPNSSGVQKIRRILAEFLGPDAESNARLFLKAKEEAHVQGSVGSG